MFKRAWLSITRKKSKTIILFIVMFVIANLVLATISIKNATDESVSYAKQSLGSEIYLSADMSSLRSEDFNPDREKGEKIERPSIYFNMVKIIAEMDEVRDYTYSISSFANTDDLELSESNVDTSSKGGREMMKGMNMGDVQLVGINSYAYIDEVENQTMTLSEGTYFDETTDNQIIVSMDLKELNDLNIGDKITLESLDGDEYELEIIGFYDTTTEDDNMSFMSNSNKIYMNTKTASQFLSEDDYNEGNYTVSDVVFYLNDPEKAEEFIEETKTLLPEIEENNLKLDVNSDTYNQMVGPIESVGEFADTILIVVIIASIVIISLIINSQIKERKYEMGVLLSLGETKNKILGQIVIELVVISTVAFVLSTATSTYVAKQMSKTLLENQTTMTEKQSENNFGRPMNKPSTSNKTETVTEIDVNAKAQDYLALFGLGYMIVFVSMILPSINIIKYEPKTILTRRDN